MIDIFYKSYSKDFNWLYHSLKSVTKYVTGYRNIVLLIPEHEKHSFDTRELPARTVIHYVKEYGTGYLFQQWCKISAHKYTDAPFIMFSDSDCIHDHPIDLNDFIKDGKPEILYTDYSKVGDAICWKQVTEAFINEPVQWEFMRRNCLIYHRETLVKISEYQPNLEHIIMTGERFSEFNAIGAYAFKYEREKYNFVNTDNWDFVPPKAVQYHSYTEYEKMKSQFPDL